MFLNNDRINKNEPCGKYSKMIILLLKIIMSQTQKINDLHKLIKKNNLTHNICDNGDERLNEKKELCKQQIRSFILPKKSDFTNYLCIQNKKIKSEVNPINKRLYELILFEEYFLFLINQETQTYVADKVCNAVFDTN